MIEHIAIRAGLAILAIAFISPHWLACVCAILLALTIAERPR